MKGFVKTKVVDENMEPLVAIVAVVKDGEVIDSAVTDRDGVCNFMVNPNTYRLTALKRHYVPEHKMVEVVSGKVRRVGFKLDLQVSIEE